MTFAATTHAACALAYLALAAIVLRGGAAVGAVRPWLALAALATVLWAVLAGMRELADGAWPQALATLGEAAQATAWLLVLARLLGLAGGRGRVVHLGMASAAILAVAAAGPAVGRALGWEAPGLWRDHAMVGNIGLSLAGLALLENLCRRAEPGSFWSVKFLCLGIGGVFAYDFFLYSDALLFRRIDPDLLRARGVTHLLLWAPLAVAVRRSPSWARAPAMSRRVVFHTAALAGAGGYLLTMGAAGFYVREFGGDWGRALQAAFLFGALLLLGALVASGRMRAHARVLIAKHFFAYRYDYREEWLRFIGVLAGDGAGDLRRRVIAALANIVDSPGGALWEWDDGSGAYTLAATLNRPRDGLPTALDLAGLGALEGKGWIIDLTAPTSDGEETAGIPEAIRDGRLWLAVPLVHRDRLLAVVALEHARAPRRLDWEDYDLLKTAGRQAAIHLSEHEAMRALADARELELFNRRFAFVVHDLKSIIAEMSLLVANAERHGEDPAFRGDLVASLGESVAAMRGLLAQINAERERGERPRPREVIDLVALAGAAIGRLGGLGPPVAFVADADSLPVVGDRARLEAILAHLLDNAREAAGVDGHVVLRLRREGGSAVVEVEDDGPGMSPEFIRDHLFRPFATTKGGGYGIGAYQCRELVRELGGRLSVDSSLGQGTTMRASLPIAGTSGSGNNLKQRRAV